MSDLQAACRKLLDDSHGPSDSTNGSAFERLLFCLLAQKRNRRNVAAALTRLAEADLLQLRALREVAQAELSEMLAPLAQPQRAARQVKQVVELICDNYDKSPEQFFAAPIDDIREQLLAINGLGPETVDSLLLWAGDVTTFPVHASAHRILKRHGWAEFDEDSQSLKQHIETSLPQDAEAYRQIHQALDRIGRDFCRAEPACENCPLVSYLPAGGPCVDPAW